MSAARNVAPLRAELEQRFGDAILPRPESGGAAESGGFPVGLRALDRLLPQGIPRRAITLWSGEATAGRTGALRMLVARAVADGALVAVVDATCTLDAADWCGDAGVAPTGLWVARPPEPGRGAEGAWVADHILRTGAFGLVVLDGTPPAPVDAHRLRSLAREADAALVVSTDAQEAGWRADVHVHFRRLPDSGWGLTVGGRFRRRTRVGLPKGRGWAGEGEIEVVHEPRSVLDTDSFVPDRRKGSRG